jgi:hypothetical protein
MRCAETVDGRGDGMKAAPEDDRIITNAMLRAQDQERIELLESALRKVIAAWDGGPTVNMDEIRAVLNGE